MFGAASGKKIKTVDPQKITRRRKNRGLIERGQSVECIVGRSY